MIHNRVNKLFSKVIKIPRIQFEARKRPPIKNKVIMMPFKVSLFVQA